MHFKELKEEETKILTNECDCNQTADIDIISVVDEIVELNGREPEKVIMILKEVQKRLNYLS